jgi:hypothetical protein
MTTMPKTIDEFKTAFKTRVRSHVLKQRCDQLAAAHKNIKSSTDELERAGGAGGAFPRDLVALVKEFDAVRNGTGVPNRNVAAELESIHRTVIGNVADIGRSLAALRNGAAAMRAGAAAAPSAAPPTDETGKKQLAYAFGSTHRMTWWDSPPRINNPLSNPSPSIGQELLSWPDLSTISKKHLRERRLPTSCRSATSRSLQL